MAIGDDTVKKNQRWVAFAVFLSLVLAWVAGMFRRHSDTSVFLKQTLPSASRFDSVSDSTYVGVIPAESQDETVGFVAIRSTHGYAGPVTVAVGLDPDGQIVGATIVKQTESPAFFRKVIDKGYPQRLIGKTCTDRFEIGDDIDAVSGATVSLVALTEAVHRACADVAGSQLGLPYVAADRSAIKFGLPEIMLILLYVAGLVAYGKKGTMGRYLKWSVLIASLIFLGFVLKRPVSLIDINSLFIGYWPAWHDNLYWYLLLAGVLLPVILRGTSPYCSHVCPFGAAQQILVTLGGSKFNVPQKYCRFLKFLQWTLAWVAVVCALVFRNPPIVSYEVSATFFTIIGRNWQFALLGAVLILSLFMTRPWCNYLCPIRAVTDYIRLLRRCFQRIF